MNAKVKATPPQDARSVRLPRLAQFPSARHRRTMRGAQTPSAATTWLIANPVSITWTRCETARSAWRTKVHTRSKRSRKYPASLANGYANSKSARSKS